MEYYELITIIKSSISNNELTVVAISGFCGAGKSTLAGRVSGEFNNAPVVSIDDFVCQPNGHRSANWAAYDRDAFKEIILRQAKASSCITYMQFKPGVYASGNAGVKRTISIKNLLIVEGVSIFTKELMPFYDISLWIDTSLEQAGEQMTMRMVSEGKGNLAFVKEVWGPNDRDFYNLHHPDMLSDYFYDGSDIIG